jgi:acetyl-CoA acetyltransferase family protein
MAAHVLRALVERSGIDPAGIDDVILGNANQAGEDNRNVARMATLLAGFPVEVPAQTVNRLCGSSLQALNSAAEAIWSGQGDLFIAGGVESMTRAPIVTLKSEFAYPRGAPESADSTLGWRFAHPQLVADGHTVTLGQTAENVAKRRGVSRADQDCLALLSQQKAERAMKNGVFAEEIVATPVPQATRPAAIVDRDEHPRAGSTLEALAKLKPVFAENGSVTAGNSSGINDGASALIVASGERATALGLRPIARLRSAVIDGLRAVPWPSELTQDANALMDSLVADETPTRAMAEADSMSSFITADGRLIEANGLSSAAAAQLRKDLGLPSGEFPCTG